MCPVYGNSLFRICLVYTPNPDTDGDDGTGGDDGGTGGGTEGNDGGTGGNDGGTGGTGDNDNNIDNQDNNGTGIPTTDNGDTQGNGAATPPVTPNPTTPPSAAPNPAIPGKSARQANNNANDMPKTGDGDVVKITGGMQNTAEFTAKVQKGEKLCGA